MGDMETDKRQAKQEVTKSTFQFGIRSVLVLTFVVSIFMWWYQARLTRIARIEKAESLLAEATASRQQFNPASLARAVNQLRLMNRSDALSVLRQYAKIYPVSDKNSIGNSLEYVLPLLFEQGESRADFEQGRKENPDWPKWLTIQGDLPFHTTFIIYRAPFDNVGAVEAWFGKNLAFRQLPLRPVDNPLNSTAAQLDFSKTSGFESWDAHAIKRQWRQVVRHLFQPQEWELMESSLIEDERVDVCRKLDVYWSSSTQRYELKK